MDVAKMLKMLELLIDDVADSEDAIILINSGLNKMSVEVGCEFPQLTITSALDEKPVFDEKYHDIPVFYAAAMYKGADSSLQEKASYLDDFLNGVQNFAENYDPPMQYRAGTTIQQYTATANQTLFTITKNDYDPVYGNLKVFINSVETKAFYKDLNTFTLEVPTVTDDKVTAFWELHAEWSGKPVFYPGW